jgi:hypothetical protein
VTESERQRRIGGLKAALAQAAAQAEESLVDRDIYIVKLRELGVGTTELARLAKMSRSGIDNLLKRKG